MKTPTICGLMAGVLLYVMIGRADAALLSYWDFNNDSSTFSSGTLGSFSTTAAAYGETYTTDKLSSNTGNGTVFNSSAVYIDLSKVNIYSSTNTNAIINGMVGFTATQASTSTTIGGYGVFTDSAVNRVSGDSSTGGSLIVLSPNGSENGNYLAISLSSLGYQSLSLSYATRVTNLLAWTETLQYSVDGNTWQDLTTLSGTGDGNFSTQTVDLSTLSGGALNNLSSFGLRLAVSASSGSFSFDNLQLNGVTVPEPTEYALFALGFGFLVMSRRFRKLV